MKNHSELDNKLKEILASAKDGEFVEDGKGGGVWVTFTSNYKYTLLSDQILSLIAEAQREARLDELHLFSEAMTHAFIEPLDAKTFADYGLKRKSELVRYTTDEGEKE